MRDAVEIVNNAFAEVLSKVGTSAGVKRGWKTRKGELPPVDKTPGGSPKKPKDYPEGYKPGKKGKGDEPPKKRSEIEMPPEMAAEPMVAEETPGGKKKLTQEGMVAVAEGAKASAAADRAAKIDGPEAKRKATEARRLAQSAKQRAGKGKTEDAQALADRAKKVAAEAVAAAKESQRKKVEEGTKKPEAAAPAAPEPAAAPPEDDPFAEPSPFGEPATPPEEPPDEEPPAPAAGEPEDPNEARRQQAEAQGEEAIATPAAEPAVSAEAAAEDVSVAQDRMSRAKTELADVLSPRFQAKHPQAAEAADLARAQYQAGEIMAGEAAKAAQAGDHDQAARLSSRARDAFLDAADAAGEARAPFGDDSPQAQKNAYANIQNMGGTAAGARRKMGDDPSIYLRHLDQKMQNDMAVANSLYQQGKYQEASEAAGRARRSARDIERHVAFGNTVEGAERSYMHQPAIHDANASLVALSDQLVRGPGSSPEQAAQIAEQTLAHGKTLDEKVRAAVRDDVLPEKDAELWRGEFAQARAAAEAAKAEAEKGNAGGAALLLDQAHDKYTAAANEIEGALVLGFVRGVSGAADQLHPNKVEEFTDIARQLVGGIESGERISSQQRQAIINASQKFVSDVPGMGKTGNRARAMLKDYDARVKDVQEAKKKAEKAAKDAAKQGKIGDGHKSELRAAQRQFETSMRQVSSMWRDFLNKLERMEEQAVAGKSLAEGEMTNEQRANEIVEKAFAKAGTSEGAARGWETRRGKRSAAEEEQPAGAAPAAPPAEDEGEEPSAAPPAEPSGAGAEWTDDQAGQSASRLTSGLEGAKWMWQEGAPDPSGVVQDEGWKARERGQLISDVATSAKQTAASLPEGHLGREVLNQAASLAGSKAAQTSEGYTQAVRTLDQARRVLSGYASDDEIARLKQTLGAQVRERSAITGEAVPDWAQEGGEGGTPAVPTAPEPAPQGDMPVPPGEAQQKWPSGRPVGPGDESDRIQLADALRTAIGEGGEQKSLSPAEKAQHLVADVLAKVGTSEGASRGWETRRGRAPAEETPGEGRDPSAEDEDAPTEVLPEPETEELPGEAHEELPSEGSPELEEMVTPEAIGPEPVTEELPMTPAGPPEEPPSEPPMAGGGETPGTPWEGMDPEDIESVDELGSLVRQIRGMSWTDTGWEQHAEQIMDALDPVRESVQGLVSDGTISPEWGEAITEAFDEMDGYLGEDEMEAAWNEASDLLSGALAEDKNEPEFRTPERYKQYSAGLKLGGMNQAWDTKLTDRASQKAESLRASGTGDTRAAMSAANDMGNALYRLGRLVPLMSKAGVVDESQAKELTAQIKSYGNYGDKQKAIRAAGPEGASDALDQYLAESQNVIDSVRGMIPENPSVEIINQFREEDGMAQPEKSTNLSGFGLGLGRFAQFADTREGRVEKAKAEMLEKNAIAQRGGGLFDALMPRELRQGSRVAAPNPETHRKL